MPGDRSVNRTHNCQKAPRNAKEYEGIQSRVNECDSVILLKLSRWEIQTIFMLSEASYEAWKYRLFRPKERRQQHCRGIQQKNSGLNRVMITVIALVASGLQAEYR